MNNYTISNGVLTFNKGVTEIIPKQFKNNKLIQRIIVSADIERIGAEAFSMCSNVESIEVESANKKYFCPNNTNSIVEKESGLLILGCKNTIIDSCVKNIGPFAFCGQSELAEIRIPSNVKSISPYAFDGCSSLIKVFIEDGLETIDEKCFRRCDSLQEFVLPKTIREIDYTLFGYCFKEYNEEAMKYTEDYIGEIDEDKLNALSGCKTLRTIYYSGTFAEYRKSNIDITSIVCPKCYNEVLEKLVCTDKEIRYDFRKLADNPF